MSVSFCLPHPVAVSAFIICRGLCACTEMCIAMGSALLFIVRSRLLVYSAGSGVNRVQVVLSRQKLCVCMVVCISWLHS